MDFGVSCSVYWRVAILAVLFVCFDSRFVGFISFISFFGSNVI